MAAVQWIIGIIVFVLILFLVVAISMYVFSTRPNVDPSLTYLQDTINDRSRWGDITDGPNPAKATCQLYTFPTKILNGQVAIPNPTFNSNILDQLNGQSIPATTSCLDTDQIIARQVQRTCTGAYEQSQYHNLITLCTRSTGGIAQIGDTDVLYSQNGCAGFGKCPGRLSLVSLSHNLNLDTGLICINKVSNSNVNVEDCDPQTPNQLFRITRIDPGQNPASLTPGGAQNGLLVQFYDRADNTCMTAGTTPTSTTVTYEGTTSTVNGVDVVFGTCGADRPASLRNIDAANGITVYPGYDWLMLPSFSFCSSSTGCTDACPNLTSCHSVGNSSTCVLRPSASGNCTGFSFVPVPPQIVYIGDLDWRTAPIINPSVNSYKQLYGLNGLLEWLIDNDAKSLFYGGSLPASGTKPILTSINNLFNYRNAQFLDTQYVDLNLYNTISQYQVCSVSSPNEPCYPL